MTLTLDTDCGLLDLLTIEDDAGDSDDDDGPLFLLGRL